jgi:hypothetical protein
MNIQTDTATVGKVTGLAIASTMTGITFWPFALTAVFAACALVYQDKMPPNKAFANVVASTAIGGAISQLVAIPALYALAWEYPFLSDWVLTGEKTMVALIAIGVGLVAHILLPALLKYITKSIAFLGSK